MLFENLKVRETETTMTLTINRLEKQNSISFALLKELHHALDIAEDKPEGCVVIVEGQNDIFCTGMDFEELIHWEFSEEKIHAWATQYMALLRRFSASSCVIIAKLDGKVFAGGLGLVAASDFVLASPRSQFKLTEALWGLLPAIVAPFLIRRIGFQKAYSLTMLARTVTAQEALSINLVDELSEKIDDSLQQAVDRFKRLDSKTISELKAYFKKMWLIDRTMEETAVNEITALLKDPQTQDRIRRFVSTHEVPWKKK